MKEADARMLFDGIDDLTDIVLSHQPLWVNLCTLRSGQPILDRDAADHRRPGSEELRGKVMASRVPLVAFGHLHNAYGAHTVEYEDGKQGMMVNAAAVITGFNYLRPDEKAELLTPRAPIVVDYYPRTRRCVLVSQWDGLLPPALDLPPYIQPLNYPLEFPHWAEPLYMPHHVPNDLDDAGLLDFILAQKERYPHREDAAWWMQLVEIEWPARLALVEKDSGRDSLTVL